MDKETEEIKESKANPCFDIEKLIEEEKYEGYYAIVTNVFDKGKNKEKFSDDKIIDIYRGLWKLEDLFRVTKQELEARPVYLSKHDRIYGHFLICYIALVIIRLIQKHTGFRHSPARLIEAMNNISCSNESENLYLFDDRSDISDDLSQAIGIDFTKQRLTRTEINKHFGEAKKVNFRYNCLQNSRLKLPSQSFVAYGLWG